MRKLTTDKFSTLRAITLITLLALLNVDSALAKRDKKQKAGELTEQVFVDSAMGYTLVFPLEWSIKVKDAGDNVRVIAEQKNYAVPQEFRDYPNYTTAPVIKVYIDTTSLELRTFVDSIKSPSYNTKQKREMLFDFDLLNGDFVRPTISAVTLDSVAVGRRLSTKLKYAIDVEQPGEMLGKNYQEFKQGDIVFVKQGDRVLMFYFVCERMFYETVVRAFDTLIASVHFHTLTTQ